MSDATIDRNGIAIRIGGILANHAAGPPWPTELLGILKFRSGRYTAVHIEAGGNVMASIITRRTFLGSGTAAAATIFIPGVVPRILGQDTRGAGMTNPVQTTAGRGRGLVRYGVNQFYGVPFAGSTAGPNRFMPPTKATAWTGVRDCVQVGERSPQDEDGPISEVFSLDRREPMGEDCLKMNVYTPGLGNSRRPVMVWLHGGGFSSGSGNWLLYDGT